LKVLVDHVKQNHSTQGHGQRYLGRLKSQTPELVGEVEVLDGPFLNPLRYRRDNLTANFTRRLDATRSFSVKLNAGGIATRLPARFRWMKETLLRVTHSSWRRAS
jgi:hypothetical protein